MIQDTENLKRLMKQRWIMTFSSVSAHRPAQSGCSGFDRMRGNMAAYDHHQSLRPQGPRHLVVLGNRVPSHLPATPIPMSWWKAESLSSHWLQLLEHLLCNRLHLQQTLTTETQSWRWRDITDPKTVFPGTPEVTAGTMVSEARMGRFWDPHRLPTSSQSTAMFYPLYTY